MEGCNKILSHDQRKLISIIKKSCSFDAGTFLVLGESAVDRCECVDVGSVTG